MLETLKALFQRRLFRYLAGVAAVGLALFIRETMTSTLGPDFPEYLVFYPTVMIVALLAGFWPGLLAMVTAAGLILVFWLIPGRAPLLHIGTSNFVGLALFMVVCGFLTAVAELYRRSRQKAAAYDREQAQRQTQEALRRQAELLKLSFDPIIVRRIGGGIESWNRGAEELYGYSEEEAQGRSLNELLKAPRPDRWGELEESIRARGEWFGEIRHITKDGREVIVSSRQLLGPGLDGSERVLEIDRDITDRKRVEEELRRAHDELEEKVELRTADLQKANRTLLMVSACDQALVQISDERELTGVICQIIQDEGGYPLVWVGLLEARERGILRSVASAGDRDGYLESLKAAGGDDAISSGPAGRAIRLKSPVVSLHVAENAEEATWKRVTLAHGFQAVAAFPLLDLQKNAIGVLVIYSDSLPGFEQKQVTLLKEIADDLAFGITSLRARVERDQAQRALELKATQLQALAGEIVRTEQRERQRIAQLLHDQIQQLLVATLYGLEGMHETRPAAEYRQIAEKLSGLVRESIAMSRSLMSELSHPSYTEPDLCTALGWLGAWVKEKHGLEVKVRCAHRITAEVEETRITLLQSVRELLFNVVKHAGVKEALVDLARGPDGSVQVTVSDEGAGFDPGKAHLPGLASGGIGLFSIRERLDVIGGGMKIESAAGRGSRVTVWVPGDPSDAVDSPRLPGGPAERAASSGSAARPLETRGSRPLHGPQGAAMAKIRVLLVDDHAVVRDGIALQLLQQPDIEIVGEAADGATALELVRTLRPDVVTMDVNMPGMNGIEAARAIHAELPRTRIIGLSMSEESEQAAAMRSAGAVHYLSKSASLDRLLAAIRDTGERE
ncbi:MAG: response regulator [Spirochaetia bacterium]|jgi:PAS domain S-box-containing protein